MRFYQSFRCAQVSATDSPSEVYTPWQWHRITFGQPHSVVLTALSMYAVRCVTSTTTRLDKLHPREFRRALICRQGPLYIDPLELYQTSQPLLESPSAYPMHAKAHGPDLATALATPHFCRLSEALLNQVMARLRHGVPRHVIGPSFLSTR